MQCFSKEAQIVKKRRSSRYDQISKRAWHLFVVEIRRTCESSEETIDKISQTLERSAQLLDSYQLCFCFVIVESAAGWHGDAEGWCFRETAETSSMQIPVRCSCGECKDWAMVELQGSLEIQHSASLTNLTIGSLCRTSTSTYKLVVGYHEIEGTKVTLKKPLVILKKVKQDSDEMEVDAVAKGVASASSPVEMHVVGIIRHKLLFKSRPKALISKQEVKPKKQRTLLGPLAAQSIT